MTTTRKHSAILIGGVLFALLIVAFFATASASQAHGPEAGHVASNDEIHPAVHPDVITNADKQVFHEDCMWANQNLCSYDLPYPYSVLAPWIVPNTPEAQVITGHLVTYRWVWKPIAYDFDSPFITAAECRYASGRAVGPACGRVSRGDGEARYVGLTAKRNSYIGPFHYYWPYFQNGYWRLVADYEAIPAPRLILEEPDPTAPTFSYAYCYAYVDGSCNDAGVLIAGDTVWVQGEGRAMVERNTLTNRRANLITATRDDLHGWVGVALTPLDMQDDYIFFEMEDGRQIRVNINVGNQD